MPEKIKNDINFPITIKEQFDYSVDISDAGLYSISISARVKSEKQISATDDEDLQIEIDGRKFTRVPPLDKPQYKDIPPAFNGSKLFNIEQNIQGGIRYFKWLYSVYYKGDKDALKKALAGYNWGIGYVLKNIPFDQISIPERVKQYIDDILQYSKEFKQKGFITLKGMVLVLFAIVFIFIIAIVIQSSNYISAVGRGQTVNAMSNNATQRLDRESYNAAISFEEDIHDKEKESPVAPYVYLNDDNKIVFVNNNGNIAGYLDKDRLNPGFFNVLDNMTEINSAIYLNGDVIERLNNEFYFFVAAMPACGSGGCSYIFYKYQTLTDTLEMLDARNIVGGPPKIFGSRLARVYVIPYNYAS